MQGPADPFARLAGLGVPGAQPQPPHAYSSASASNSSGGPLGSPDAFQMQGGPPMQRQQPQPQQSQAQHSEQGNGAFDHASGDHSALRLQATVERTLKKYSDDILRVLEAINLRVGSLEESHERLASTVQALTTSVVELKDGNIAISRTMVDRADMFSSTLETAAGNVQVLRDRQTLIEEQQRLSERTLQDAQVELARIKDVARSVALEVVRDLKGQEEQRLAPAEPPAPEAAAQAPEPAQPPAPAAAPAPAPAAAPSPAPSPPPQQAQQQQQLPPPAFQMPPTPLSVSPLPSAPPPSAPVTLLPGQIQMGLPSLPLTPESMQAPATPLLPQQLPGGMLHLPGGMLPPLPQLSPQPGLQPGYPVGIPAPPQQQLYQPQQQQQQPSSQAGSYGAFAPPPQQQQLHQMGMGQPPLQMSSLGPPPPQYMPQQHMGGGQGYPPSYPSQQQRQGPPPPPPPPPPHMQQQQQQQQRDGPPTAQLSTSKVPVDKVVDDLSSMGFTKDEVRAVMRKLTESGQPVDLNVVIDKLMNGEGAAASAARRGGGAGWFTGGQR